ncbi:hypothetical protein SEVIR_3G155800v4 [Setaria viridis]|uniref:Uncharacterized protein n=1 Tax=Setaria viridis TaxID=4556 RepID=A0A4U6VBV8_SETVI|nr:hypothetical protein SEVIR_3G155800v2 [Setaria viridis]
MGNSLPLPLPCACVRHHEADEVENAAAKKRRRKQKSRPARRRNVRAAARSRHVVPVADTPASEEGDGGEEAWRPGCRVEPAGCGEDGGGVRRVKIVMRRKDIAELVARLEQRDAAERSATVMEAELSAGLGGDGSVNGGSVAMSPCRDAWRPRLSIIPENY